MLKSIRPNGPCRVQTDVPRDELKLQLEVYKRDHPAAGLRGRLHLGADRLGGRHRQRVHPAPGVLLGAAAGGNAIWWGQGETGQVVALWRPPQVWPVALQREAFKPPARLRLPMPGLVFVCSPGRAPWVYAATSRPTGPEQHLFRAPAFNVFGDGRVCPGSHRFPEEVGLIPESFFQSYFSLTGDSRNRSKKHPDNLHRAMGGARWTDCSTRLKDLVPQCTVGQAMAVSEGRRGYRL